MTNTNRPQNRALKYTLLGSLVLHVVGAYIVMRTVDFTPDPIEPTELTVNVVTDDDLKRLSAPLKEKLEKREREKREEEKEKEVKLEKVTPLDRRKAVDQVTNEERPTVAKYVSNEDNKVAEETRAREVTKENVKPSNDDKKASEKRANEANPKEAKKERSIAGDTAPLKRAVVDGLIRKKQPVEQKKTGNPFAMPTMETAERILDDPGDHDHSDHRELFANYEQREAAYRASLENFITEVKPGNHTGVNAHKNVVASYVAQIHRSIHPLWGQGYLIHLDLHEPRNSGLHEPSLNAKIEIVIDSSNGKIEAVNIVKSSGEFRFDAEAVSVVHQSGSHPAPPKELISPNGKVYVHWNFWRDARQCGTFGANVFLVDTDKG